MRGLRKPWPPQNVSPGGVAPRSFRDAEREFTATLPSATDPKSFARAEFDRLHKPRLRETMIREQGGLCVFCERGISADEPARIDYWRPLHEHPELALHWRNLHLSCSSPETCDACKGKRALRWRDDDPDLPWPADCRFEDLVGYTSRGEMYVRADVRLDDAARRALENALDDLQDSQARRPATMNLNHPTLVAARAAMIDRERTHMERDFAGRRAERSDREQRAAARLAEDPLPPFVSIRVAWLRLELGKGRDRQP